MILVYQDLCPSVENRENRALQDQLGVPVNKGQLEIVDQQVPLVRQVQKDNQDHQALVEILDLLGQLDRLVNLGYLVRQEQLVVMVSRVSKASREILALMEHQGQADQKDRKAAKVHLVQRVHLVQQVLLVLQDLQGQEDHLVLLARQVLQELMEHEVKVG